MDTMNVSLTILFDWEHAQAQDFGRADKLRTMFSNVTVDAYGRTATKSQKVLILQGITTHSYVSFATHLANIFPIDAIEHFGMSQP